MRTLVQKGSRVLHAIMPAVYLTSHAKCALSMLDGHKGQKQNLCPVCLLCTEDVQRVLWVQKVPGASFLNTDNVLRVLSWMFRRCSLCVLCVQKVPGVSFLSTDNVLCVLDVQEMSSVSQLLADKSRQWAAADFSTTGKWLGQRQFKIYMLLLYHRYTTKRQDRIGYTQRTLLDYSTAWTTPI